MDRAEQTGLGVAVAGHVLLFGALSLGFLAAPKTLMPTSQPVDVQLVDDVGLTDTAPNLATEAPAPSIAPELGQSTPAPDAAQTPSAPSPAPQAAAPRPTAATPRPSPASPAPPRTALARPTLPAPAATQPHRGSRLGADFLNGITDRPSVSTSQAPRAAAVGPAQIAGLGSAIRRQVQPCADRIVSPGPGAERIVTKLNLRMNRDGSFAQAPQVVGQTTDDENSRYAARVGELARAAFMQCAPFELPPELYDGWKNINLNYKLPE